MSDDDGLTPVLREYQAADANVAYLDREKAKRETDAAERTKAEQERAQKQAEEARGVVFTLEWFRDITPCTEADDFVQGLLCDGSSAVVYGSSNAGKTFWMTDLALHVAAGMTWNGKRVQQGGVIYCALEGSRRFRNRIAAWRKRHSAEDKTVMFAAIQIGINLLTADSNDTQILINTIKKAKAELAGPVRLVVIDTLARAMAGGNENASEDMGKVIKAMDFIRQETGACVLFIHHSGKDAALGMRGHTSLIGAIDTEIEVAESEDGARTAEVLKQRDLQKGEVFGFTLQQWHLGENQYGEPVTSCIVEQAATQTAGGPARGDASKAKREDPGHLRRAMEVLHRVIHAQGKPGPVGTPDTAICVAEDAWREKFYSDAMPGAEPAAKQKAFRRAADKLVASGIVGMSNGLVWAIWPESPP